MAKKKPKNEPSRWQSKIVGHAKVAASQLLANPFNHRRHPEKQRQVVAASIEELGFIKSVIVNQVTGHIVDGHERVMQALGVGEETMVDVEYVNLSPDDEKKALLLLDASSELAEIDASQLDTLVTDCSFDSSFLNEFAKDTLQAIADLSNDDDSPYTRKIEAPVYKPRGDKPCISELADHEKCKSLIKEIESCGIQDQDLKAFLLAAASRHIVFDFENIAEFYAHAPKPIQELMEKSALVIIDLDDAISKGYCQLSLDLAEEYADEYPVDE
jgi:hypothetical protein